MWSALMAEINNRENNCDHLDAMVTKILSHSNRKMKKLIWLLILISFPRLKVLGFVSTKVWLSFLLYFYLCVNSVTNTHYGMF